MREIARLKVRYDKSSKLVAKLKKEISKLSDKLRKKEKENKVLQQELRNTKLTNLPFEARGIQALVSGMERLKDHHLEKSRLAEAIPT